MRRYRIPLGILLCAALLLLFASTSFAQSIESQSGDRVTIEGSFVDMVFAAGRKVSLSADTNDDVYAIGGNVDANGLTADHVSIAGGNIVLSKIIANDLLIGGGNILFLEGNITDDAIIAAADLTIEAAVTIEGSAILSGAIVDLENSIGGDARIAGEHVILNGPVGGSVEVRANRLTLGENAHISGDLEYTAKTLDFSEAAIVSGETREVTARPGPHFEPILHRAYVVFALFGFLLFLGVILLILVTVMIFPDLMNKSRDRLSNKPFPTLGIGFLIALLGPASIAVLMASVLGIPLALMIGATYLTLVPIALAASIYTAGFQLRSALKQDTIDDPGAGSRLVWTALASLLFCLVAFLPILGSVVWILAFTIGLGAVAQQVWISLGRGNVQVSMAN